MTLLSLSFGSLSTLWRRLKEDTGGIALIELAIVLPSLLVLGLFGVEIMRMSVYRMQVSQIALSLSDNASRLGQTDNSGITPTIPENDVDALLDAAMRQGEGMDLEEKGRVILTSLEYDAFEERQFIKWQRCRGELDEESAYGDDGNNNGLHGAPIEGMGRGAQKIAAQEGLAVMYVEIYYEYDGLFDNPFGPGTASLRQEAAFIIRDDRNLGPGLTGDSDRSTCS